MSEHPKNTSQAVLQKHAALFDDMGSALGLDLQEEVIAGRLPFDALGEAVLRCSGCAHPDRCASLLKALELPAAERLRNPPSYCRNRDLLGPLARA